MIIYRNKKLGATWNIGDTRLERENMLTLYGEITEEMAETYGYEKEEIPDYHPTEEETKKQDLVARMTEIKSELTALDYLTSKEADGEDMSEYGDYRTRRKALRSEYRELESKLNI